MIGFAASVLIGIGFFFYLAGTVGMLRFPDAVTRLHALTKADNTGLGFTAAGVALLSGSWLTAALIAVVWLLAVTSASIACHLIARNALYNDPEDAPGEEPGTDSA